MVSKNQFIKRLSVIVILITFLFTCVIGKLFYVQVVDSKELQAKALDQWTRDVPYVAERGGIFDRNDVLLAGTTTGYTCFLRPTNVTDFEYTAKALSTVTGISYDKIYEKITKKGASEITVAKSLTKDAVNSLISQDVEGVYFSKDIQRYYPYGDLAAQLLGFCNVDTCGQSGLELYYDDYLKGVNGQELTETDIIGRELSDALYYLPSIDGAQLTLTVDKSIQFVAESAVKSAISKYQAKSASCIVMDKNGGVVAMAQAPSFDLNNIDRSDLQTLFQTSKLSSICNVYETGSVFKIITMAAAIEEGLVTENDRFSCPGFRIIDGQRIKCWKTKGHGSQSFAEGVMNSCNCVFMDLALRLGKEKLYEYYEKFNLTTKTGIDFLGESQGLTIKPENAKTVDIARMGFGQAIAVTPLELISAVNAIVGGGIYKKPHILEKAYDYKGRIIYEYSEDDERRVVSESTSDLVRKLLLGVVSEGSGKLAGVSGYLVGGKTGTAQKYLNGAINRGKYLSSFIGYCTYEDPKYVVYFYVDEPSGYTYYGSQVAAPYVGEIFKEILSYENVEPTKDTVELKEFIMPSFEGLTYQEAKKKADNYGIYLECDGEGDYVTWQFPPEGSTCNEKCVLLLKFD